jgi:hypothetical protein
VSCPTGDDEFACNATECVGENVFACGDGQCIPRRFRCDHQHSTLVRTARTHEPIDASDRATYIIVPHCVNGADERNCTGEDAFFACNDTIGVMGNKILIRPESVCDGFDDCGNGRDELGCK